jgi:hypothetical protein
MTNAAMSYVAKKTSSNCVIESSSCSSEKPMPTVTTAITTTATGQETTKPTPMMTGEAKMQLHAGNTTERTNVRTAMIIGKTKTTTTTAQKIPHSLPTPLHKAPTQTGNLDETKAWKANALPIILQ